MQNDGGRWGRHSCLSSAHSTIMHSPFCILHCSSTPEQNILSVPPRLATFPRMAQWPAAVLFDFDGVLVNSEPLHFQAFREVLAAEHIELSEDEYYRELI